MIMASIARVSLRRNNNLVHRLFRLSHSPVSAVTPRVNGVATLPAHPYSTFFSVRAPGGCPLPSHIRERCEMMRHSAPCDDDDDESDNKKVDYIWNMKEDEEAVYIKMEMPGVSKEDVNGYLDNGILVFKGVRKIDSKFDKDDEEEDEKMKMKMKTKTKTKTYKAGFYVGAINMHNMSEVKAEMKDGVLKVTVPRIKEEERTDVLHIKIQ